jgi:hypothetical protein
VIGSAAEQAEVLAGMPADARCPVRSAVQTPAPAGLVEGARPKHHESDESPWARAKYDDAPVTVTISNDVPPVTVSNNDAPPVTVTISNHLPPVTITNDDLPPVTIAANDGTV